MPKTAPHREIEGLRLRAEAVRGARTTAPRRGCVTRALHQAGLHAEPNPGAVSEICGVVGATAHGFGAASRAKAVGGTDEASGDPGEIDRPVLVGVGCVTWQCGQSRPSKVAGAAVVTL